MNIKVLGSGCARCQRLEEHTRTALAELHIQATIEHVRDVQRIASYGVEQTPSLVVDDTVVIHGMVPEADIVKEYIQKHMEIRRSGPWKSIPQGG
jgi:small redox-active disulfide protein 2